jgi:hypothetical protein
MDDHELLALLSSPFGRKLNPHGDGPAVALEVISSKKTRKLRIEPCFELLFEFLMMGEGTGLLAMNKKGDAA